MSNIRAKAILAALSAKGFVAENRDHTYLFFQVGGKKTSVFTYLSHGARDSGDWLLAKMSKQLHLGKKELLALIECTLSEEEYRKLLEERGFIRR